MKKRGLEDMEDSYLSMIENRFKSKDDLYNYMTEHRKNDNLK